MAETGTGTTEYAIESEPGRSIVEHGNPALTDDERQRLRDDMTRLAEQIGSFVAGTDYGPKVDLTEVITDPLLRDDISLLGEHFLRLRQDAATRGMHLRADG